MENKELINYGGAVVGGIIGNVVNQKFTKYRFTRPRTNCIYSTYFFYQILNLVG